MCFTIDEFNSYFPSSSFHPSAVEICMPLQQGLCDDKNLLTLICTSRLTQLYLRTNTHTCNKTSLIVTTQLGAAAKTRNKIEIRHIYVVNFYIDNTIQSY